MTGNDNFKNSGDGIFLYISIDYYSLLQKKIKDLLDFSSILEIVLPRIKDKFEYTPQNHFINNKIDSNSIKRKYIDS